MSGFIKLHRKMLDWRWYKDRNTKVVFLHILLTATHKAVGYKKNVLQPGQVVTTLSKISAETGLTVKQVRRALDNLEQTGELGRERAGKETLISVANWASYQSTDENRATLGQEKGNERATLGQEKGILIEQECKEDKEVKNKKEIYKEKYGEFQNVLLSDAEYEKLVNEFPADYQERIERLSDYMASKGKRYKNHLATIRAWARKDRQEQKPKQEGRLDWIDRIEL